VEERTEVAIVGSGFSGLAMAARLKRAGGDDFVILERAREVGGTWRDNSYPGCACDVPSHLYSFSFAPNPEWSSTFSPQPEIGAYLRRVADEEGLRPHIRFGCEVEDAGWDADAGVWRLTTSGGGLTARFLVAAAGPLSEPKLPDVPGLRDFKGRVFHSASWDHDHDLTGERVAVVGTGASSIQFIPQIQPKVGRLHLFQRTAPWVLPRRDRPLTRIERAVYRRLPAAQRAMRSAIFWARESFAIPILRAGLAKHTRALGLAHIARQVPDPELRRKLTPAYAPGCKRILISNDYYPALRQDNVEVVAEGVARVGEHSVIGADGTEREVDTIIFGTGFHVTDLPIADRLRDGEGRTLAERWDGSLSALRGTTVAGFPNLFILLGPNTGLGHNSVVFMAECQADYVMQALEWVDRSGAAAIDATPEAENAWNDEMQRRMEGTVWTAGGCESWYIDARGRNTTLWPDFSYRFRRALADLDEREYRLIPAEAPATPARERREITA
jgi:cation diffusion facilitator CzcD-associated flavoprotein CzcO